MPTLSDLVKEEDAKREKTYEYMADLADQGRYSEIPNEAALQGDDLQDSLEERMIYEQAHEILFGTKLPDGYDMDQGIPTELVDYLSTMFDPTVTQSERSTAAERASMMYLQLEYGIGSPQMMYTYVPTEVAEGGSKPDWYTSLEDELYGAPPDWTGVDGIENTMLMTEFLEASYQGSGSAHRPGTVSINGNSYSVTRVPVWVDNNWRENYVPETEHSFWTTLVEVGNGLWGGVMIVPKIALWAGSSLLGGWLTSEGAGLGLSEDNWLVELNEKFGDSVTVDRETFQRDGALLAANMPGVEGPERDALLRYASGEQLYVPNELTNSVPVNGTSDIEFYLLLAGLFGAAVASQILLDMSYGLYTADDLVVMVDEAAAAKVDSDEDGVPDVDDAFPDDATQTSDRDGDGYGDNIDGNAPDHYPDDPSRWAYEESFEEEDEDLPIEDEDEEIVEQPAIDTVSALDAERTLASGVSAEIGVTQEEYDAAVETGDTAKIESWEQLF